MEHILPLDNKNLSILLVNIVAAAVLATQEAGTSTYMISTRGTFY